ncbi:hypothetical protein [Oscillatoria sp. HE19RPO]|nr:hypothetical protein [Oscillatoria sp. HE19RPO]
MAMASAIWLIFKYGLFGVQKIQRKTLPLLLDNLVFIMAILSRRFA